MQNCQDDRSHLLEYARCPEEEKERAISREKRSSSAWTASGQLSAVRSGSFCQTSQHLHRKTDVTEATAEVLFTVQSKKYIRANHTQFSASWTSLIEQNKPPGKSINIHKGKHAENNEWMTSDSLELIGEGKNERGGRDEEKMVEKCYCCKAICSWLLMCWSPAMKKICPLMRNLP